MASVEYPRVTITRRDGRLFNVAIEAEDGTTIELPVMGVEHYAMATRTAGLDTVSLVVGAHRVSFIDQESVSR